MPFLLCVRRPTYLWLQRIGASAVGALTAFGALAAEQQLAASFAEMSIEDLGRVQISSVSKKEEPLNRAAAAVYVITNEDIRRSGANSIPEMLRLAPNLQVAQVNARLYSITARGFGSANPNKLLVLIDGRAVYSPLHAAVFWDAQDVLPEDVERIEVISGPGGTVWGVNAVNGVINIITRNAADSQGFTASAGTGNAETNAAARYGGTIGENLAYRFYAKAFDRLRTFTPTNVSARDGWRGIQGGFRTDWHDGADQLTLQGDFYGVGIDAGNSELDGQNVLGRWQHRWSDAANTELQVYWDRAFRSTPGSIGHVANIYDVDLRHTFDLGDANAFVAGGGYRLADGRFTNTPAIFISPAARKLKWANVFLQDTITFTPAWRVTLGAKYEHSSYSGGTFLPSARLSWTPTDTTMLWAAASRAERGPSQLDRDFNQRSGAVAVVVNGNFQPEKLWAYELGYRGEFSKKTLLSISGFYNVYSELRTTELSPGNRLPAIFGNMMEGETYGVEIWANHALTDWWRISPGFTALHKDLRLVPGSRDVSGLQAAGNDPNQWFTLRSNMTVGRVELDVDMRQVSALPNPRVPGYGAVDIRIGWHVTDRLDLSLLGSNLTNRRHAEFGAYPARSEIPRTFYAAFRWRS